MLKDEDLGDRGFFKDEGFLLIFRKEGEILEGKPWLFPTGGAISCNVAGSNPVKLF
jgi:hypothetical protein